MNDRHHQISRELLGKIVDDVFDGAIEDASVIEEIYAAIKKHETPPPQDLSRGLAAIAAERERQITKGYDAAHDDGHVAGDIINSSWGASARIYAAQDRGMSGDVEGYKQYLIQAAAQIVAEVERVDRAALVTPASEGSR